VQFEEYIKNSDPALLDRFADGIYYDHQSLYASETGDHKQIIIAKRQDIDPLIKACKIVRLYLKAIDVDVFSMARLMSYIKHEPAFPIAFAFVRNKKLYISVFGQKKLSK
jgi:hypothetical protein